MRDWESSTLTRALDWFARNGLWGTVTARFERGTLKDIETHETVRPQNQANLAAIVGAHPAVAAALLSGEAKDFVFARLREGKLTLLAVESHHKPQEDTDGRAEQPQPRRTGEPPRTARQERGPGSGVRLPALHPPR